MNIELYVHLDSFYPVFYYVSKCVMNDATGIKGDR